jgi:sulfite exporter TauE/SafE/copper chaperone CopZ
MHCVSCEILIKNELNKIDGISISKISAKKGEAVADIDDKVDMNQISEILKKFNFSLLKDSADDQVKSSNSKSNDVNDYIQIIFIFLIIGVLFYYIDFTELFPEVSDSGGVLTALLLGLIASLSSCLAIIGGLVVGFSSLYSTDDDSLLGKSLPHIKFHIGRIVGFFILGGLLGVVGSKITYSSYGAGVMTIVVAVVMFYMALQVLNLVPNITRFGLHLPKFLSEHIHSLKEKESRWTPPLLGALTFFLPCGFTQSMQLLAISSQSFLGGGFIMAAFAAGTFPVLFLVGLGSSFASKSKFELFHKVVGVVIVFFAISSLNSGLILTGNSSLLNVQKTEAMKSEAQSNFQIVRMDIDYSFRQTLFKIKKDIPVRWEINAINLTGCSNEIIIPKLGISKKLIPGKNLIEFTPTLAGSLPFSCWMGMMYGEFIVE